MLPEITDFAVPLALVATGLALAVLVTVDHRRVPVPAPALFLIGAAIASDVVPSLNGQVEILTVERIAVVALIVILLNGGRDIGAHRFRRSSGDISAIGLVGTFATAAAVAVVARIVLGLDWAIAGVLGAALAPTDPAVMFSVLGRREVGGRSGTVLEGEAGINDPGRHRVVAGHGARGDAPRQLAARRAKEFALKMGIGLAFGLIGGRLLIALLAGCGSADRACIPCSRSCCWPALRGDVAGRRFGLLGRFHRRPAARRRTLALRGRDRPLRRGTREPRGGRRYSSRSG